MDIVVAKKDSQFSELFATKYLKRFYNVNIYMGRFKFKPATYR